VSSFIESLRRRAAQRCPPIVFPEGDDTRTIDAVARIQLAGLARPVVLGDADTVRREVAALGADADAIEIIDPARDARRAELAEELARLRAHKGMDAATAERLAADPLIFGALLVRTGHVHGSVAGAASTTADVLRAALWCVGTSPGIATVSSAFYMIVPSFLDTDSPAVLTFADGGVVPEPTAEQLADVAAAAAHARRAIVGDDARVAFLSYATRGSAGGASVDKMRAAYELFRTRHPAISADGELQADAALVESVRRRKAPDSLLRGPANVLIFPDLDAANIAYKLVQRLAHAEAIGPILQGLARPCNDLSRGATADDIVNVACVTALTG
jgi:phosphate acetyltransferase